MHTRQNSTVSRRVDAFQNAAFHEKVLVGDDIAANINCDDFIRIKRIKKTLDERTI